jgi:hypothetical protein
MKLIFGLAVMFIVVFCVVFVLAGGICNTTNNTTYNTDTDVVADIMGIVGVVLYIILACCIPGALLCGFIWIIEATHPEEQSPLPVDEDVIEIKKLREKFAKTKAKTKAAKAAAAAAAATKERERRNRQLAGMELRCHCAKCNFSWVDVFVPSDDNNHITGLRCPLCNGSDPSFKGI